MVAYSFQPRFHIETETGKCSRYPLAHRSFANASQMACA
jgi:hypothetical protein